MQRKIKVGNVFTLNLHIIILTRRCKQYFAPYLPIYTKFLITLFYQVIYYIKLLLRNVNTMEISVCENERLNFISLQIIQRR